MTEKELARKLLQDIEQAENSIPNFCCISISKKRQKELAKINIDKLKTDLHSIKLDILPANKMPNNKRSYSQMWRWHEEYCIFRLGTNPL